MKRIRRTIALLGTGLILIFGVAQIAPGLVTLNAGDPIDADVVNHNFTWLDLRVDSVQHELDTLSYAVENNADRVGNFGTTAFGDDGQRTFDCIIGEVRLSAASFGYGLVADGRLLSTAEFTPLFSLIGTLYGGDGRATFALPDLRDVAPQSQNGQPLNYYVCVDGVYPVRN